MSRPDRSKARSGVEADVEVRLLRQFRIVFNAVKSHFQQVERRAGASAAQVWALHLVCESPGLSVTDLARALDVRQPAASGFVRALAEQGLVEIRRGGVDRRAVQLHPTGDGRRRLRTVPGAFSGFSPRRWGNSTTRRCSVWSWTLPH